MSLRRYLSPAKIWRAVARESRALLHAIRSGALLRRNGSGFDAIRQRPSILTLDVDGISNHEELKQFFTRKGIRFSEGYHSLYVPPQSALAQLEAFSGPYPPDAGFKILKRFAPISHASYLLNGRRQIAKQVMMGGINNQADAATLLYLLDLGPCLYDLAEVQSPCFKTACFVVEHIAGDAPSHDEWQSFMTDMRKKFSDLNGAAVIVPHEGWDHMDFRAPDCSGNLIKRTADGRLFYIDPQQFLLIDKSAAIKRLLAESQHTLSFGGGRRIFGQRQYMYQSIPGLGKLAKRDVLARWKVYQELLTRAGIELSGRAVLDICCNAGMFLALALANGASIGLGWDLPEVVSHSARLQCALGNTRITMYPAHLHEDYPLSRDISPWVRKYLEGSVVFYLAARKHIGYLKDLSTINWSVLVYEGHQEDNEKDTNEHIRTMERLWGCKLVARSRITGGDSASRPVAVLSRISTGAN